jgi:ketosteroid isomerase-like protein
MSERNVEIVRRVFDAFSAVGFDRIHRSLAESTDLESAVGDLGELGAVTLEILDPDVELDFAGVANWPDEQTFRGHQGWFEMWRAWLTPWGDFAYEVREIDGVGEDVYVEVGQRGVIPGSDAPIEATIFNIWTLRDGRVVRLRFFSDREEARAALGKGSGG